MREGEVGHRHRGPQRCDDAASGPGSECGSVHEGPGDARALARVKPKAVEPAARASARARTARAPRCAPSAGLSWVVSSHAGPRAPALNPSWVVGAYRARPSVGLECSVSQFRPPRFDAPVDLEAHLRLLPPDATNRGMFFNDLVRQVQRAAPGTDIAELGGVAPRRYLPFLEYPYADFLRLVYAAAKVVRPGGPVGEGLRQLGRTTYATLLESHAGRVLFAVLGIDFEQICRHAPKGYRLAVSFAQVTSTQLGPQHFVVGFRGLPGFLETFQVGVVEGAAMHCNVACSNRGRHARPRERLAEHHLEAGTMRP